MTIFYINPGSTGDFLHTYADYVGVGAGVLVGIPLAISLLIELELRDKNERVQRVETKRLASLFNVLGHLVTSELRSMTPNGVLSCRCL